MTTDTEDPQVEAIVRRFKHRDPVHFAMELAKFGAAVPPLEDGYRLAMGLDLGSSCGYTLSWFKAGVPYDPRAAFTVMGQLDLSAGQYDSGAIRFVRLRGFLMEAMPHFVCYELVRFTPSEKPTRFNANAIVARAATSMEWFGALKGVVSGWAEEHGVPCQGYGIGAIKKRATNKGNAGKPEVIAGINEIFGVDLDPANFESTGDDNIADSASCLLLGLEEHARGLL